MVPLAPVTLDSCSASSRLVSPGNNEATTEHGPGSLSEVPDIQIRSDGRLQLESVMNSYVYSSYCIGVQARIDFALPLATTDRLHDLLQHGSPQFAEDTRDFVVSKGLSHHLCPHSTSRLRALFRSP